PPLLEQTVGDYFSSIVAKHGDRKAVISRHQQTQLTYDELDRASNALARGLQRLGVEKGDRVAVFLGNNIEHATLTYALFKLGGILVPLNPGFNAAQVVSALAHLEASHLIISTETNLPRKDPRSNVPLLTHLLPNLRGSRIESELVPSLKAVVTVNNSDGRIDTDEFTSLTRYQDVAAQGTDAERPLPDQALHPNDIINIQFTSGTTSMPKAACLTHRSILNNGKSIGDRMLLTPEDIVCCPPPLFHCFGCVLGYMATATHGSTIVFPSECFNAEAALRAVQEYRATALYGVPTMFLQELELLASGAVPSTGLSQLRTGIAAGSSIPAELMRKLHRVLNLTELTICYGMTETSPVSAMTTTDDPLAKRIETVGRPLPHVTAKVVAAADRTKVLGVGERGELVVSGYLTMKGYWGDEEKTAEVLVPDAEDGGRLWMHTGDEASIDADGYVSITGRIKDLIIKGGENIHPLEVENCLLAHPAAFNEVSVVGLPDERYGEAVAAFIVITPHEGNMRAADVSSKYVRDWVREKLSHHLVPKYVFLRTEPLPKTPSGKIMKYRLREEGIAAVAEGKGLE
ncbi:putative acyl-CoA synthetase YngI, partial [Diplodia seriata]